MPLIVYPTTGELVPEPLGLVLIFSSWNFPVGKITMLLFCLLLCFHRNIQAVM